MTIGDERLKADIRSFGGLLLTLGACAVFSPLAEIATAISPDTEPEVKVEEVDFWRFVGQNCLIFLGSIAMLVGYMASVHTSGSVFLTCTSIFITQLAWIPFAADLYSIGDALANVEVETNPWIPIAYAPNQVQAELVGGCGFMGIIAYSFGFIGSIAFLEFALLAYFRGNPQRRDARYYRCRMQFYSLLLALAGVSLMMLGVFVFNDIQAGPLDKGPVAVAMYVVYWPEMAIAVGSAQAFMGFWGVLRCCACFCFECLSARPNDSSFQWIMGIVWLALLGCQIITQLSWAPKGARAPAVPAVATLALGLHLLPAFLDYKVRTTPADLDGYYSAAGIVSAAPATRRGRGRRERVESFDDEKVEEAAPTFDEDDFVVEEVEDEPITFDDPVVEEEPTFEDFGEPQDDDLEAAIAASMADAGGGGDDVDFDFSEEPADEQPLFQL